MNDWKLILKVIVGSALLLFVVIFGLSKIADPTNTLKVEEAVLLDGARFVKENGETKVTVVNFSDIECPSCKASHAETKELINTPGVRYVLRFFPLVTIHQKAEISAKAVEVARIMNKGWEMLDLMFDKQQEWSSSSNPEDLFVEYAKGIGLDEATFKEKLNSAEVAQNVQIDAALAGSLRLSGTPTYFVNGEQVGSPFVVSKVKELLEQN